MSAPSRTRGKAFSIAAEAARRDGEPVYHSYLDPQRLTGTLELAFEALAPIHAGSGVHRLDAGTPTRDVQRRGGFPIVPGTSIKGACRQVFELLTDSPPPWDERFEPHRCSRAAALFGTLGYHGRISFDDAIADPPTEPVRVMLSIPYQPPVRDGWTFYRPAPRDPERKATIPALAFPARTRLVSALRLRNVTRSELGSVLLALGFDRFALRLGGARYDDLGRVRTRMVRYRLRTDTTFGERPWVDNPAEVEAWCRQAIAAFRPTAGGRRALAVLAEQLPLPAAMESEQP